MAIQLACPECGKSLKVKDESAGKRARCPSCQTMFEIPSSGNVLGKDSAGTIPAGGTGATETSDRTAPNKLPDRKAPSRTIPAAKPQPPCPECGSAMKPGSPVCIKCGYDPREQAETAVPRLHASEQGPQKRSRKRLPTWVLAGVLPTIAILILAAAVFVFWKRMPGAPSDRGKITLRWQFKEGEQMHVSVETRTATKMNIFGQNMNQMQTVLMYMTLTVKRIDENGMANLTQTIDRVRFEMESPAMSFVYDSKDGKELEGDLAAMGKLYGAMVGTESEIKTDSLGQGLPMLGGTMTMSLPRESMASGMSWKQNLGDTYTYRGNETRGNRAVERIDMVQVNADPSSNMGSMATMANADPSSVMGPMADMLKNMKIKSQDSSGVIYFDNARGRLVEATLNQTMVMEINVMGQATETTTETTTITKLVGEGAVTKSN